MLKLHLYIEELVQERRNSSALAMILQACNLEINKSMCISGLQCVKSHNSHILPKVTRRICDNERAHMGTIIMVLVQVSEG